MNWRSRNVFVTGGAGYVGHRLVAALIARGANVIVLVRDVVMRAPFVSEGLNTQVTTVNGEVEDFDLLNRALREYEVDCVFHLAGQAIVSIALQDPVSTFETNIGGTWNVLEACRGNSTVSRIIIASSDKAYGSHPELPYSETHSLSGAHPYDVSKSCADLIANAYHHTYRSPVAITRCGNIFGPGDLNFSRIVPGTIRAVLRCEQPVIRSDGTPIRDYVFVDDIVHGYLLLAERMDDESIHGQAFNFATGEPVSVLELTKQITALAGRPELQPLILNQAKAEIDAQYLSSDKARQHLGWSPSGSLASKLRETIDWYRDYLSRMESATPMPGG